MLFDSKIASMVSLILQSFVSSHVDHEYYHSEYYYAHCVKDLKKFQLTKKKIESKASAVRGHLLFSHHSSSFDRFLMVTTDNSEFYWVERESVIIESNFYRETWNLNHVPIWQGFFGMFRWSCNYILTNTDHKIE